MSAAASPAELLALQKAASADTEFSFSGADFQRVRQLIYQRAGISLHDGKHAMVYSRLSRRLRETGIRSFGEYLQWLETGNSDAEWQEFVNCLTTNLTSFFRESHHFDALLSELRGRGSAPLRICATRHRPAKSLTQSP
jgi:chemotaxis protein methyltransferase CheR